MLDEESIKDDPHIFTKEKRINKNLVEQKCILFVHFCARCLKFSEIANLYPVTEGRKIYLSSYSHFSICAILYF